MRILILLALVVATVTLGCNGPATEGPERFPLSGAITYKGAPLPAGKIYFEPNGKKNNSGPMVTAEIKDGKYETPAGKGTVGGAHIVRIDGYDAKNVTEHNPLGDALFINHVIEVDLPKEKATEDFTVEK
ncbi:hypothetical protein Pan97_48770 [Bremerella volcania]|uniref:Carboxypeptidase regulatory-like domain-containing protein n=1 Tax=Bremerella volcania TaxID=2527984 RepID=A0A518CEZ0_9BACT|nr:hypothetical protein [Bremerella volcania]QDU77798.1 hypothetical protein Pan97_48770 [Bremerella volcania]